MICRSKSAVVIAYEFLDEAIHQEHGVHGHETDADDPVEAEANAGEHRQSQSQDEKQNETKFSMWGDG